MKLRLPLLLTLFSFLIACQQDTEILPKTSPLYQEWNWIGYRNSDGSENLITPIAQLTLEFRADGSFVTRTARKVSACCVYTRFRFRNEQLVLENFNNNCTALCGPTTAQKLVIIKELTDNRLELDFGGQRNLYQPLR